MSALSSLPPHGSVIYIENDHLGKSKKPVIYLFFYDKGRASIMSIESLNVPDL